jgi:signal transduction histidine kinase
MVQWVKKQRQDLAAANGKLFEANRDLELKIEHRTSQLETANARLGSEIAEKEDFLRAISHDLNAPLRNIAGMATMLLNKHKDGFEEDVVHRLERIKKNVDVETDLIAELLELSRIKTRRQKMELVNLEALIWEMRGLFENDLKSRGIELIIDTSLPALNAERARIRQVFQNLIDNAIKYMGDGEKREIHVGCTVRLTEAEFYVRDTGMGIEPEDVEKVFFVFRRGKNSAAKNIPGKGVGLASVKSIVETYNGTIWVESKLGEGTTFRFTINGKNMPLNSGSGQSNSGAAASEQHSGSHEITAAA